MKFLKFSLLEPESARYFKKLIISTFENREQNGSVRPDMLHLLLKAQKGELAEDDNVENSKNIPIKKWNDNELTAQCVTFLGAGFETSATLLSFLSYELAVNPDVQEKLFHEVCSLNTGDDIGYENLSELKYMDMVISETLRKWPPFTATDRSCTERYTLKTDDGSFETEIEKGKTIWIPVYAIHHDPKYYDNPEKFIPERFSEENKSKIQPFTYLPFGAGNRNCLGNSN
jgi:cytochrome P450 family 9